MSQYMSSSLAYGLTFVGPLLVLVGLFSVAPMLDLSSDLRNDFVGDIAEVF